MSWDAHKEFTERAAQARKAIWHVCGDVSGTPATVGKHEAKNHEHLRQVYAEAKESFPRFADTLAWLLWHDIVDADRLEWLSKDALIEAERRGAERMRERAARLMIELGHVSESGETLALEIRALPLTEETTDADA